MRVLLLLFVTALFYAEHLAPAARAHVPTLNASPVSIEKRSLISSPEKPLPESTPEFELNSNCREAYVFIQALQFGKAREWITLEKQQHPRNTAVHYLEGYIDFLSAFITEEDKYLNRQKQQLDSRLDAIEAAGKNNPWALMARAELTMQLAINKLKWQEFVTSGYLFRRSYKMLEENRKQHPSFLPNLKSLGFCHAAIGAVPSNYQWLANLAGMRGTVAQGAAELDRLMAKTTSDPALKFLNTETSFIRAFVAIHFEKNNKVALDIASGLSALPAPGPLQRFLTADIYILTGDPAKARKYLATTASVQGAFQLCYLDFLTGTLKLEALDYSSETDLKKYTSEYNGKSFIKAAWQKQGWIRLLNSDTSGYFRCMDKVKTAGDDFTDEDKQALKEAQSGEIPNVILLKARLLTDGGNYTAALSELAGKPVSSYRNTHEQLELTYRLARIYDKMGNKTKALEYYELTYRNGGSRPYYFAANAALLIGNIHEERGDKKTAESWYKNCLALRDHEYQNSIDQKARSGLNRISSTF